MPARAAYSHSLSVGRKYSAPVFSDSQRANRAASSFDPRLPAHLQLFIKRIHRDEKRMGELEQEVESFLAEVADTIDKLGKLERKAA